MISATTRIEPIEKNTTNVYIRSILYRYLNAFERTNKQTKKTVIMSSFHYWGFVGFDVESERRGSMHVL